MRRALGFNIVELVVALSIAATVLAVLMPIFRRDRCIAQVSHCQYNMNQIGKALKMYLSDWDDTFPINGSGYICAPAVPLSDPSKIGKDGDIFRFQHGPNWVEALWPYVEKVSEGDAAATWKCPATRARRAGSAFASVTYAFNANLVARPEGVIKNAGILMMAREMECMYDSVLRPSNISIGPESPPIDPLLDPVENGITDPKYKLHGDGSHILFADGHVKSFGMAYFPRSCEWDGKDRQWYNYVKLPAGDPRNKSIAVSM